MDSWILLQKCSSYACLAISLPVLAQRISFYPAKAASFFVSFWAKISFFLIKRSSGIDQKYLKITPIVY